MKSKLVEWVIENVEDWKNHRDTNYLTNWKKYERLWRGVWDGEERSRSSERSKFISPALQQAIENHTSEIEEAVFGAGGNFFSIDDDMRDTDKSDIEYVQAYMKECFKKNKLRKAVGDSVLLASIYGTGIGEIVVSSKTELVPATQPLPELGALAIGTEEKETVVVSLKPISPQNFIIDPTATSIEEAMGVAIEEFVGAHVVADLVKKGVYLDTKIEDDSAPNTDLEASWLDQEYNDDKIRLIRYYGLVPRKLLENIDAEEVQELFADEEEVSELMEEYGDLVEAIIVIGDDEYLLKAEENPYMMKDRPVVAYQDDTVPNRFWGRGVAEKGYNTQMAIDAQIRSHLDSLALTTVPMMGMDATRMPRGAKFEVRPGKSILTNGNPAEILMPFKFGKTDGSNLETASTFERMLSQATGTADTSLMQTQPQGDSIGISLSGIIKKNKRTLVNFQDQFLIPFIQKAAWRFMQFDPENFPVKDFKFIPNSTLGMLAREVEQLQFINLLKTLGPDSPMTPIIMKGVIENSSLPNKQEMLASMEQAQQPNPEQQQQQMMVQQAQIAQFTKELEKLQAEIDNKNAMTAKTTVETQLLPQESQARIVSALSTNLDETQEDKSFEKRVKLADLMLREQEMDNNKEIVQQQMKSA